MNANSSTEIPINQYYRYKQDTKAWLHALSLKNHLCVYIYNVLAPVPFFIQILY